MTEEQKIIMERFNFYRNQEIVQREPTSDIISSPQTVAAILVLSEILLGIGFAMPKEKIPYE